MIQGGSFLLSEGDRWFERNTAALNKPRPDKIMRALGILNIHPTSVLEIGCANGWRLETIRVAFKCWAYGLEPSEAAIEDGFSRWPNILIKRGLANALPYNNDEFDLVIYGFCLYLCDREHLLQIASEGDRVLRDGGHIVIMDFNSPSPYSRVYHHNPKLLSYKMDYPKLWLGHPAYSIALQQITGTESEHPTSADDCVAITILKKSHTDKFPVREYT